MKMCTNLKRISLIIVMIIPFVVFSQNIEFKGKNFKNQKDELKEALSQIALGDIQYNAEPVPFYDKALEHYMHAQKFNPNNAILNFKVGICKFFTYQAPESLENFERAFALDEYVDPDIDYYLGVGYQLNMNWDKAEKHLSFFKTFLNPKRDAEEIAEVNLRIAQCEHGRTLLRNPRQNVVVKNLGGEINSKYSDYGMVISPDSIEIYFTSRRPSVTNMELDDTDNQYFEDIFKSLKVGGNWSSAQNAGSKINVAGHNGVVTFSPDRRKFLIFIDEDGVGNLFECTRDGNEWTPPVKITGVINSDFHETSAWYSPDGQKLYFVSERVNPQTTKTNLKNKDIFVSNWDPANQRWGSATPLPTTVNTEYDEDGVYVHPDGKTIYFSSKGHNSMGGYDIFKSELQADGSWSQAENMGYPINSPGDDVFFYMGKNKNFAYMTSYRKGGYGEKDLYQVTLGKEQRIDTPPVPAPEPVVEKVEPEPEPEPVVEEIKPTPEPEPEIVEVEPEPEPEPKKVITELDTPKMIGEYKILGLVRDAVTREPLLAEVKILSINKEIVKELNSENKTGVFKADLEDNKGFQIRVSAKDYISQTQNIKVGELNTNDRIGYLFNLEKVGGPRPEYAPTTSRSTPTIHATAIVYFQLNSHVISSEYKKELDRIIELLKEDSGLRVELSGHTDCRDSDGYNKRLSDRRVKAAKAYIAQRIPNASTRIATMSFGESQLVNDCPCDTADTSSNCTEEQHQMNRRVEVVVK